MDVSKYWLSMMKGEKLDRVPVIPLITGATAKVMGYPNLGDYYSKPKVSYKCHILARELYRYDQPPFCMDPGYGAACWGSKIAFPYGPKAGSIAVMESAVKEPGDLDKVEIPEARAAAYMSDFHELVKLSIDSKQMPMVVVQGGWVSATAPHLVTLETFMMWMYEEPELVKKALNTTAELGYRVAEYFSKEFGTDTFIPWAPNPTDSNTLISADFFGQYTLPVIKNLHKRYLNLGFESLMVHWCSDHKKNIERGYVDEIPMGPNGVIHFGPEVPMDIQVKRFGKKFNLMGNPNPPLMMQKTYDEWMNICKENIDTGIQAEKIYALACGCGVPPPAPACNVMAMTKAADMYGKYPKK